MNDPSTEILISVAFGRCLDSASMQTLQKAARLSEKGDDGLAHIHLDLARLSRLPSHQSADDRLRRALRSIQTGATYDDPVFSVASSAARRRTLNKFDSDQARVPAGNGREGGRWTRGPSSSVEGDVAYAGAAVALPATEAAPLFAPEIGPATLAALSSLFAAVGAVATLGVVFVPWQKETTSSGTLPGSSGTIYRFDADTGLLRLQGTAGSVPIIGQLGRGGVFYDVHTGVPFGRTIDGAVVLNQTVTRTDGQTRVRGDAHPQTDEDTDEPTLCPAPIPDKKGSEAASVRAKAYQEQIASLVNGTKGLKYGLAMGLIDPDTGRMVHFDECVRRTGMMIEAKGPGYAQVLGFNPKKIREGWLSQSLRQVRAAGNRPITWYIAERKAADVARNLFAVDKNGREKIRIRYVRALIR